MRFVFTSALKDLRRLRREPVTILMWLGIPTFIALILVVIFGRGEVKPHGTLLVADEDPSIAGSMVTAPFNERSLRDMITVERVSIEEGRRRVATGNASALLIIPKGFTAALFQGQAAKIDLIRNPAQRILPEIIAETVSTVVDAMSRLEGVRGDPGRTMSLIQLDTRMIEEKTDRPGGFAMLMLPGMIYMAVFFIAGGLAADVWRERTAGALRRVVSTPANFGAFLAGKLFAAWLVLALVGAFGLAVAHYLVDLRVSNLPLAVFWIGVSGVGLYLFMMLLQSLASNERVANMLTNFVMLPLTMLGGSFFPFDLMPKTFARIGKLTPNGWSLLQLQRILNGSPAPAAFVWAAVFIVGVWLLTAWRIRRTAC